MATAVSPYENRPETLTQKVSATVAKNIPEITGKVIQWLIYTFVRTFRAVLGAIMEAIRGR